MTSTATPPVRTTGAVKWVKDNLFRTWWDTSITIIAGGLLIWLAGSFLIWVFTSAQWEIVRANLTSFMVGRFPRDQLWRVAVALLIGAFMGGLLLGMTKRLTQQLGLLEALRTFFVRAWPFALLLLLLVILAESLQAVLLVLGATVSFLVGRGAGYRLPKKLNWMGIAVAVLSPIAVVAVIVGFGGVGWDLWGGLLLTLFLAIGSIILSFPFGVLLALGRRSKLPAARWLSITYIEIVRGVPLIALLFMGFVMLALFLPPGTTTPSLSTGEMFFNTNDKVLYIGE